jgi:hypothetical protein
MDFAQRPGENALPAFSANLFHTDEAHFNFVEAAYPETPDPGGKRWREIGK